MSTSFEDISIPSQSCSHAGRSCGFIAPFTLVNIANAPNAHDDTRAGAQAALNAAHGVHTFRKTVVSPINPASGFLPPHVFSHVARAPKAPQSVKDRATEALHLAEDVRNARKEQSILAAATKTTTLTRAIYTCNNRSSLPGTLARREGSARVVDRSINNCYDALGITYNFYLSVFGRNSLDNNGLALLGSVHYERNFNNALWDGTRMIFGDGDGIYFDAFTDSLDVVAHELTHAVTQYTAGLEYSGQSGALNESVSDVFACMAEQWHFRQTSATADWLLGQTLFPVARRGAALRSLKAPGTAYDDEILGRDPQPATMAGYRPLPDDADNDYGGVHLYSGIPNHAFYLVAMALGGNSWEKPGQIWYKTLTGGKIGSRVDFAGFAKVTVEMARMLYGESVALSVKGAWEKVGVLTSANAGR